MNGAIDKNLPPRYPRALSLSMGATLNYQGYIQALNYLNEYTIRADLGQLRPKGPDASNVRHALV